MDLLPMIERGERFQVTTPQGKDETRQTLLTLFTHCEGLSRKPQLGVEELLKRIAAGLPHLAAPRRVRCGNLPVRP